jgi:hypothetical protein
MKADNSYRIVDDFQVGTTPMRVLVLDREYNLSAPLEKNIAVIGDKEYAFNLNSVRCWATVKSQESFKGKTVTFC